ncbi:MAG: hypothetical protein LBV22_02710 [Mycoplasmataceae bacterium]|jgi:hypothetical protein|nr:hypothetical protein [Mycoplasmataceae bacterium]
MKPLINIFIKIYDISFKVDREVLVNIVNIISIEKDKKGIGIIKMSDNHTWYHVDKQDYLKISKLLCDNEQS